MKTKIIIVDDEAHCRLNLRASIAAHCDWQILHELDGASELKHIIKQTHADVVFLDISMPGMSGIDAAKQIIELNHPPLIVFVTAFDSYAIDAFEVCALDYLLKPFDSERFLHCAARVNAQIENRQQNSKRLKVLAGKEYLSKVVIKSMSAISLINTHDISYLACSGNYVEIYHQKGQALLRSSLSSLLAYLDPAEFCQVHRKYAVRFKLAKDLHTKSEGKYLLVLSDGNTVPVSETYKHAFIERWLGEDA